jgi:hypothetical protein
MDMTFAIGRANTVNQHTPHINNKTGPMISHAHKESTNDKIESDEEDNSSKTPLSTAKESSFPPWSGIFITLYGRMLSISAKETIPFSIVPPASHTQAPASSN